MDSATRLLSKQKFYAFCGILGPILFAILVTILGLLRQDYSHAHDFISDLGTPGTPYAPIMSLFGFTLLGILLIFFTVGLNRTLRNDMKSKMATIFMAIYSGGFIGVAAFPFNKNIASYSNLMHNIFGLLSDILIIIALFIFAQIFKNSPNWKNYWLFTLLSGVLITLLFLTYLIIPAEQYLGLLQRAYIGLQLLWIEIIAIKLFLSGRRTADSG